MAISPALVALFERRQQAIGNHDSIAFAAEFAEDCVVETPFAGTLNGAAAVEAAARHWLTAFPDFSIRVEETFVDGDHVIQVVTLQGTDTGGLLGFPATGQPF